jgi:hypothetical protein
MRNVIVITCDLHWRRFSYKENVTPAVEDIKMKMETTKQFIDWLRQQLTAQESESRRRECASSTNIRSFKCVPLFAPFLHLQFNTHIKDT